MNFCAGICISKQVEKSFLSSQAENIQLPFLYGVNFRNARGLARVTYSGTPVGSVVDICHKNEMQCSSFQKFTSFFEHILLQNCLVALPYQPRTTDAQRANSLYCTAKFLGTAAAYFVCHIGPIFQISLNYAFNGSP